MSSSYWGEPERGGGTRTMVGNPTARLPAFCLLAEYVVACYASDERANLLKHWQNQVYVPLGMGI
jgi:hypothetical protein